MATIEITTRMMPSAPSSEVTSARSPPLSITLRTISRKCVDGTPWPMNCAQPGMPAKGNMKPESRIEGRMVKKLSCIACIWLRAAVEMRNPSARLTRMKMLKPTKKANGAPSNGTAKMTRAAARKTMVCT